jgi:hypothetical protein
MMRKSLTLFLLLSGTSFACAQPARDEQTVVIGPWEIATTFKGDKFDNCSMNRVVDGIAVSFVRTPDGGLLLLLDSPRWKLERGKSYPVRLSTGSQLLEANALAEAKAVTIALPDIRYSERLKAAAVLQVRGEGATRAPWRWIGLKHALRRTLAAAPRPIRLWRQAESRRPPIHIVPMATVTYFVVAYVYFEDNDSRRAVMNRLSRDEALPMSRSCRCSSRRTDTGRPRANEHARSGP